MSFNSVEDFLNSDVAVKGYDYDMAFIIPASHSDDAKITKEFRRISHTSYKFCTNNCATVVAKSLNAGGIKTYMGNDNILWTNRLSSYVPSRLFLDIMKHNNGILIEK